MQLLDLKNLKIVEDSSCPVLELKLCTDSLFDKTMSEVDAFLCTVFNEFLTNSELTSPVYIKIFLEDESFTAEDVDYAQQLLLETFTNCLIKDNAREREMRLAVPSGLNDVDLSYVKMMRLVNKQTVLDCFGVEAIVCGYKKEGIIHG